MTLKYPNTYLSNTGVLICSIISGITTPICAFQLALHQSKEFGSTIDSTTGLLGAISFFSLLPLIGKQTMDLFCKSNQNGTEKTEHNPHHTHSYFIALASSTLANGIAFAQIGLIEVKAAVGIGFVCSAVVVALALRWKMDRAAESQSNAPTVGA